MVFVNSGDPDQIPHSAVSDLSLHCLPVTCLGVSSLQWVNVLRVYQCIVKDLIRLCRWEGSFEHLLLAYVLRHTSKGEHSKLEIVSPFSKGYPLVEKKLLPCYRIPFSKGTNLKRKNLLPFILKGKNLFPGEGQILSLKNSFQ